MKISIFPNIIALPRNKEEKNKESRKTGIIRDKKTGEIIKEFPPEIVDVVTSDDLFRILTTYAWSPSIFNGCRHEDNFKSSDFAVLDFDKGVTMEEIENRIIEANFTAFGLPSTSHTPEAHRFRVIFPLSRTVTNLETYRATLLDLMEAFPECDAACKDGARFFFGCKDEDGFMVEGDLLEPVTPPIASKNAPKRSFDPNRRVMVESDIKEIITELYGEERDSIPEVVSHFIKNAHTGLSGEWVTSLNAFVFTLSLQGIDLETIFDLVEFLAPRGELTKRDEDTIERAYKDGEKAREEET